MNCSTYGKQTNNNVIREAQRGVAIFAKACFGHPSKTRRTSLSLVLATEPLKNNVFGKVCPFKADHDFILCTLGNKGGLFRFPDFQR
jgi:hypothetical protein